jgi:hypothetical protein
VTRFWYTLKNLDLIKCKTCHGKSEEKGEFGNPWSESLGFKCGTLIMLGRRERILNQIWQTFPLVQEILPINIDFPKFHLDLVTLF